MEQKSENTDSAYPGVSSRTLTRNLEWNHTSVRTPVVIGSFVKIDKETGDELVYLN